MNKSPLNYQKNKVIYSQKNGWKAASGGESLQLKEDNETNLDTQKNGGAGEGKKI